MEESKKLSEIEKYIAKFAKNYIAMQIYNEKLDKNILYLYLKQSKHILQVFDENYGVKEIARIDYVVNDKGVYISDFVVEEDFQRNGIGKSLFNIAMAHGDAQGAKLVYGTAAPISGIYGVSNEEDSFENEKKVLMQIYTKLGCKFDTQINLDNSESRFYQVWASGEKLSELNQQCKLFLNRMISKEQVCNKEK